MPLWLRFRVCGINCVVPVYREPAYAAELPPFREILPVLRQNLDPVVVAVGDDQPSLRVELDRVRCRNSPGPVPVLPMTRRNLPLRSNTEIRPTRFGSSTFVWLSAT